MILNERMHDDEVWWEGSARGLSNCEISSFRNFLLSTNLVEYAEGHDNAFGVGLKDIKVKDFITLTNQLLKDIDFSAQYLVDEIFFNIDSLDPNVVIEIGRWEGLWGQELPEPYIAVESVKVTPQQITLMKNSTLKISTPKVDFIKFKATEEEIERLQSNEYNELTIIGRCNINNWGGREIPQIFIEDYEITKSMKYYY